MPLPVFVIAAVAGAALLWAANKEKAGPGGALPPSSTPPIGGPDDWFTTAPNGVLVVRPEKQSLLFAVLQQKFVDVAPLAAADVPPGATVRVLDAPAPNSFPALGWIAGQCNTAHKHVILSLDNSRPMLAAVTPGAELQWCAASLRRWALIAEAQGVTTPTSSPQGGQGGQVVNVPGFGPMTIPNMPGMPATPAAPGGTVPASSTPSATPPTSIEVPGFGTIPLPGMPGAAPAQPTPNAPTPSTPTPSTPSTPTPGSTVQTPWGPVAVPPGLPTVPGLPSTPSAPTPAAPGLPGNVAWPAQFTHTIRPGDIASRLAQWYTGNFMRAYDLVPLNNLTIVGKGPQTQFVPWQVGQVLKLPLDWNTAKGVPPLSAADIVKAAQVKKAQKAAVVAGDSDTKRALRGPANRRPGDKRSA